jgi:hypothetical protein
MLVPYRGAMADSSWRVWREPETVDTADRPAVAALMASLMREFIAHRDVSPALVGRIESLMDTFQGTEWWADLEVPIASYEPWGGEAPDELYSASQLAALFTWALPFVEAEANRDDTAG